ncbi:MAG: T9SS type A sorting domain-containing protein [Crocinitomicaceae bacterium]|nr:T9SS type A sorting domain-containing protein [Crocinitomicaceae bacterium]
MRHLIILFFLLSFSNANAQSFAPQEATWHYSEAFFYPSPYLTYFMKFEVVGDSIINGINCSKIHKERKMFCNGRNWNEFVYTANDTVFFYDSIQDDFHILYDFNALAGDSWEIPLPSFDGFGYDTVFVDVDSTDFVSINSTSLKRLFVTYTQVHEGCPMVFSSSSIIETLGDVRYLFNFSSFPNEFCDANWSTGLRCYEDSIIGFYESGIADSCEFFEIYNDLPENDWNSFTISPNPADEFVKIDLQNGHAEEIRIIDFQGRLLITTKDEFIDLSDFNSGMYLVRVLSGGKWSERRLIKM